MIRPEGAGLAAELPPETMDAVRATSQRRFQLEKKERFIRSIKPRRSCRQVNKQSIAPLSYSIGNHPLYTRSPATRGVSDGAGHLRGRTRDGVFGYFLLILDIPQLRRRFRNNPSLNWQALAVRFNQGVPCGPRLTGLSKGCFGMWDLPDSRKQSIPAGVVSESSKQTLSVWLFQDPFVMRKFHMNFVVNNWFLCRIQKNSRVWTSLNRNIDCPFFQIRIRMWYVKIHLNMNMCVIYNPNITIIFKINLKLVELFLSI